MTPRYFAVSEYSKSLPYNFSCAGGTAFLPLLRVINKTFVFSFSTENTGCGKVNVRGPLFTGEGHPF